MEYYRTKCSFAALALLFAHSGVLSLAAQTADSAEADRTAIAVEALSKLKGVDLEQNAAVKAAVLKVLERTRGRPEFVQIIRQFNLRGQETGLLELAQKGPGTEAGVDAMRLLLEANNLDFLQNALRGTNALPVVEAMGNAHEKRAVPMLLPVLADSSRDLALRKQAVRALVQTQDGAGEVLKLAREDKLPQDLKFLAGSELNAVRWPAIKDEAAKLLPPPQGQNDRPFPPLTELLKMKGDAAAGAKVFSRQEVGCINCHRVKGQGTEVGPDLSEIGSKLGKDALVESVLDPSAGVSFGYEANQIELKSGDEAYGIVVSDTTEELAVKDAKGIVTRFKKSEIARRQVSKQSIMPTGLQATMTVQDFVDLIEYLATLKKAN